MPGVGGVESLGLADSDLATGTNSLAMHESGHSVTIGVGMLGSARLKEAWQKDRSLPNGRKDTYRMDYIEEYIASAVDDYYCNEKSREYLRANHPNAFAFMENDFIKIIVGSRKGVPAPGQAEDSVSEEPSANPDLSPNPLDPGEDDWATTPGSRVPNPDSPDDEMKNGDLVKGDSKDLKPDPVLRPKKSSGMCV